jgi:GNAT superfamily N-acetyltransferase
VTDKPFAVAPLTGAWIDRAAQLHHDSWHETQARLQHACLAAHRDIRFFTARVESRLTSSLVATSGQHCVGYAAWEEDRLASLFVDRRFRGGGVGTALCVATEMAMAAEGRRSVWLDFLCGNNSARHFYERNGWTLDSIRAWPVECPGINAMVQAWKMVKATSSSP